MLSMNHSQSRSRQITLALVFIFGFAWVAGEASQLLLRMRAQKLLADIGSLSAGRSTWSDAQPIMQKWQSSSVPKGTCTAEACTYRIELIQTLPPFLIGDPNPGARNWLPRLADHLGLRSSAARAGLNIEHGVVTTRWFGEQVTVPVRDWNPADNFVPYLTASSAETSEFGELTAGQKLLHPNRLVQHKATYVAVTFSPAEDPTEQAALMDFRFSCITRFRPCESEGDILPEALQMWQEQLLPRPSR